MTPASLAADLRRAEAIVRELPEGLSPLRALAAVESAPHTVFFESGGDAGESSDWTLLAFDPARRIELGADAPLEALAAAWPERAVIEGAPPIPFLSGLAGYIGYDFKDRPERVPPRPRRGGSPPH